MTSHYSSIFETSQRWRERRASPRATVLVLLLGASALLGGCTLGGDSFEVDDGQFTTDQVQEVEAFLGAPLPDSAEADQTRAKTIQGGLDDALLLRLTIPAGDVTTFLASIGLDKPLRDGYQGALGAGGEPAWFQTGALTQFAGASIVEGNAIEVTVDNSDPTLSTLYLRVYEI